MTKRLPLRPIAVLAWLAFATAPLAAEEPGNQSLRRTHTVSGSVVHWAFRDAIRQPRTWTAALFHDGSDVALGTVVGADGWILTKGSELKLPLTCRLADGRQFPAQYVSYHEPTDLALLKIDAHDLPTVEFGTADPEVGQWLITPGIGRSPLAVGIVSTERRVIPRQHYRGVLGIQFDSRVEDPLIERVFPDSAAAAAELEPGDVIVKIGERAVVTRREVQEEIATRRPGDVVTLQVRREERLLTLSARLTHPFGDFLFGIAKQNQMGGELSFRRDDFPAAIQTDAVLDPNECGGSAVTLSGQAVGINIARAGRTETYVLPADQITPLLERMKAGEFAPPAESFEDVLSTDAVPPPPAEPERVE